MAVDRSDANEFPAEVEVSQGVETELQFGCDFGRTGVERGTEPELLHSEVDAGVPENSDDDKVGGPVAGVDKSSTGVFVSEGHSGVWGESDCLQGGGDAEFELHRE